MAKNCKTIVLSNCPPVTCDACKEIYSAVCVKYFGDPIGDIASNGDTLVEILQNINILLADAGGCENPPTQFVYAGADGECTGDALATRVQSNGHTNIAREFVSTQNVCRITTGQIIALQEPLGSFDVGDTVIGGTSGASGTIVSVIADEFSYSIVIALTTNEVFVQDEGIEDITSSAVAFVSTGFGYYVMPSVGSTLLVYDIPGNEVLGNATIVAINGTTVDVTYDGEGCPPENTALLGGNEPPFDNILYIISSEDISSTTDMTTGFRTMTVDGIEGSFLYITDGVSTMQTGVADLSGGGDQPLSQITTCTVGDYSIEETSTAFKKDIRVVDSTHESIILQQAQEISIGVQTLGADAFLGVDTGISGILPFFSVGNEKYYFPPNSTPSAGDILEIDFINGTEHYLKWSTPVAVPLISANELDDVTFDNSPQQGQIHIQTKSASNATPKVMSVGDNGGTWDKLYLYDYLEYVCTLDQAGTGDPTEQAIISNTLGGTITWARNDVGEYTGTLPGTFDHTKMTVSLLDGANDGNVYIYSVWKGDTTIKIYAQTGGAPNDDSLRNASFQLKIYR